MNITFLSHIFAVMAPVLVCALIGFLWARKGIPYESEFVSRIVLNIGAPALIIASLGQVDLQLDALAEMALAVVLVAVIMSVIGLVVITVLKHDVSTYLPSLVFPNVGNMGLPVCLYAFQEEGLALALSFFMILSLAHFPVGIGLSRRSSLKADGQKNNASEGAVSQTSILFDLLKMPILWAIPVAVLLVVQQWQLPLFLANSVELIAGMTIPLMLITLGISLQKLQVSDWFGSVFYSAIRIFGGLLVGWLVCEWLAIEGVARGIILLQSSMPVAVFNYLFAERYQCNPTKVAGMVVTSTFMAFVTIPALLLFIL